MTTKGAHSIRQRGATIAAHSWVKKKKKKEEGRQILVRRGGEIKKKKNKKQREGAGNPAGVSGNVAQKSMPAVQAPAKGGDQRPRNKIHMGKREKKENKSDDAKGKKDVRETLGY